MVHQNPQPLLVPAAGEDYEALALHPYADLHHHHQQQQQIFEPVIYVNKPFWKSASRLKKAKAKAKAESRKNKKSRVERYDLSTTTVALYLLRYNVALQIAATAIVINLLLSVATFACGLNSLYCAFGMDCVIGTALLFIYKTFVYPFSTALRNHHLVHPRLALRLRQNRAHQGADRGAGSPLPPQRQQWIIFLLYQFHLLQ